MEAKVDRLVIKENKKSGIIDYELVSYIPSNDVIAKPYNLKANQLNKLDIEFDGYILHKNIGGEIILLEKIKAGILEKKLYKTINKNRLLKTQGIKNDNTTYCSSYCFREIVYEPTCNCYIRDYVCFSECYEVTNFPGVTIDNGVVSFESNQSFFEAYTSLDNAVEQHNSNFYDSKEDKTDEEVDMISTQVNFDDVKPLRDFENLYGIASLRQKIQNEENIWLENSVLNPNTGPDVLYSEPDDVMRTFFNQNQTLKIAGIYRGTPSDGVLTTNSGGSSSECRSHARYSESNENHMYDNNTRSAKLVASFNGLYLGLAGTRIIARTKNFKKKSSGNWKKFATSCYAGIGGQVVNVNCYGNVPFSTTDEGYERRRSYKASKIDANVPSYIKRNEMSGVHEVRFKLTYQRYFTW